MNDHPKTSEECIFSNTFCPIDDLVRDDEMPWSDLFPKRTYGRKCDNGLTTNMFESGNVGMSGDFGRCDGVSGTMTGNESDKSARREFGDGNRRRWFAPWLKRGQGVKVVVQCSV